MLRTLYILFALCPALFAAQPNFVIILADDLGYSGPRNNPELGQNTTPNMNRLAAEGMRFTDGHSSSGCCSPSRYTLLTGRYHWRTTLQSGIVGSWGKPLIAKDRLTIASLAKEHGYATACIGKWHLGRDWPITNEQKTHFARLWRQTAAVGRFRPRSRTRIARRGRPCFRSTSPAGRRNAALTSISAPMYELAAVLLHRRRSHGWHPERVAARVKAGEESGEQARPCAGRFGSWRAFCRRWRDAGRSSSKCSQQRRSPFCFLCRSPRRTRRWP